MEVLKIKKQRYFPAYYLIWFPFILTYQITNRFHFIEPRLLKITWMDRMIPFVPWMIPVYVSYLVYTFVVIARSRDDREVKDIFVLTHIQLFLSVLFFVFYPVTFPRDQFYYAEAVTAVFNQFWIVFDAPNNCFPSLHTILCLTAIRHSIDKPHAWFYTGWGIMIILSALTCKQHYVIDIAAGVGVYFVSVRLFNCYCSWRPGKTPVEPPSSRDQ